MPAWHNLLPIFWRLRPWYRYQIVGIIPPQFSIIKLRIMREWSRVLLVTAPSNLLLVELLYTNFFGCVYHPQDRCVPILRLGQTSTGSSPYTALAGGAGLQADGLQVGAGSLGPLEAVVAANGPTDLREAPETPMPGGKEHPACRGHAGEHHLDGGAGLQLVPHGESIQHGADRLGEPLGVV